MAKFQVVEKFVSINGEGTRAGQLAVFIRFKGCNLNCSFCDTTWANEADAPFTVMTDEEIYQYIEETGVRNVTLTGGEPLLREGMDQLFKTLHRDESLYVEIETNGSMAIDKYRLSQDFPAFTMDYKLPVSGMERQMNCQNFASLKKQDTVKFVCGSQEDLQVALRVISEYKLVEKCSVYLSPVFGSIEASEIVDFMIEHKLNGVNVQLQMHKYIWDPNERGV